MSESKPSKNASDRPWILYDADCGVCKFILARILELDRGKYRPLALQDPRAERLLPDIRPEERLQSFHIVDADGTVHSAGDGLAELIPGLERMPRGLVERAYWMVAGNRRTLGRLVPEPARRQARRRIAERED